MFTEPPALRRVLVEPSHHAQYLALDDTSVYVSNHSVAGCTIFAGFPTCSADTTAALSRVSRDDGVLGQLMSGVATSATDQLGVYGEYLYVRRWVTNSMPLPEAVITRFSPTSVPVDLDACAGEFAVAPSGVFIACRFSTSGSSLSHIAHSGTVAMTVANGAEIANVAVTGGTVYFNDGATLQYFDTRTGGLGVVHQGLEPWRDLAAEGTTVVGVTDSGAIEAIDVIAGSSAMIGAWDPDPDRGEPQVAIQARYVYYRSADANGFPRVTRVRTDGLEATTVLELGYSDFAVDGDQYFWTLDGAVLTGSQETPRELGDEDPSPPTWALPLLAPIAIDWTQPPKLAAGADGGVLVAASTGQWSSFEGGARGRAMAVPGLNTVVAKYSAAGDAEFALVVEPDLGVYEPSPKCAGFDDAGAPVVVYTADSIVKAHFASNGSVTRKVVLPGNIWDCIVDPVGGVYTYGPEQDLQNFSVRHLDSDGNLIWSVAAPADVRALAPMSDGVVGVAGSQVFRVSGTGVLWTRAVSSMNIVPADIGLATNNNDEIVLAGEASVWVDAGSGPLPVIQPGLTNTFLVRLGPLGEVRWVRTLDGAFSSGGVALGDDETITLVAGGGRPFYFGPPAQAGNQVFGVTVAKLDACGEPLATRNLLPHISQTNPPGRTRLSPAHIVARDGHAYITGTLRSPIDPSGSETTTTSVSLARYDF